jgi:hypothetical protein
MLSSAGPGIAPRACIFVSNTIQAFLLLELSSRDVTTVRLSFNGRGSIRELIVTSAYLSYNSDKPPPQGNCGTSPPTAAEITCSSSLDVMLMHTTLYRGALASIPDDNFYCSIW